MDRICKLDILAPAQAELEEIARVHMALSGPRSAQEIPDKIYDAMEQLTRFPLSGPPVRDEQLRVGGYRYILAGKYLVIYLSSALGLYGFWAGILLLVVHLAGLAS